MRQIILLSLLLLACDKPSGGVTTFPVVPDGLKDCQMFYMSTGGLSPTTVYVVRCPNSTTAAQHTVTSTDGDGNTSETTIRVTTIDGR